MLLAFGTGHQPLELGSLSRMFQQISPKGRKESGLLLRLSFSRIIPHIRDEVAKSAGALGERGAEHGLP